jgi:hypothetical protein
MGVFAITDRAAETRIITIEAPLVIIEIIGTGLHDRDLHITLRLALGPLRHELSVLSMSAPRHLRVRLLSCLSLTLSRIS